MYSKAPAVTARGSTRTGPAPVKAIALPAVYRANLEYQSHVPFQHSRTRVIDSRTRGRRGFCTLVHSLKYIRIDLAPQILAITSLNLVQFHNFEHQRLAHSPAIFWHLYRALHLTSPKIAICPISKVLV